MFLQNNKFLFLGMLYEAFQNRPLAGWNLLLRANVAPFVPLERDEPADSPSAFRKRLKNHPTGKMNQNYTCLFVLE
jgi:hypothetical protein